MQENGSKIGRCYGDTHHFTVCDTILYIILHLLGAIPIWISDEKSA
jgi:hypothetical protein